MNIDYNYYSDFSWGQKVFERFLDLVAENLAVKNIESFEKVDVQELCFIVNQSKLINETSKPFNYQKTQIKVISKKCKLALQEIKSKYTIERLIEIFYFEKMRKIFTLSSEIIKPEYDANGLPIATPLELKSFICKLFETFNSILATKIEGNIEENPPIELLVNISNLVHWKIPKALEKIIMGKFHKGINLFDYFLFQVPKHKRITQSLLINQSFLRLCHTEWDKLILLEDDKNSLDFQLAVLDLIPFIDIENKMLFNKKAKQYRQNYVTNIIESSLLLEIEKRYFNK